MTCVCVCIKPIAVCISVHGARVKHMRLAQTQRTQTLAQHISPIDITRAHFKASRVLTEPTRYRCTDAWCTSSAAAAQWSKENTKLYTNIYTHTARYACYSGVWSSICTAYYTRMAGAQCCRVRSCAVCFCACTHRAMTLGVEAEQQHLGIRRENLKGVAFAAAATSCAALRWVRTHRATHLHCTAAPLCINIPSSSFFYVHRTTTCI